MRKAHIHRKTFETDVDIELNLDSNKKSSINTTIPFMDHMLTLFSAHAGVYLNIKAKGDTEIDDHHLVEDMGITLGQVFKQALGDKKRQGRVDHHEIVAPLVPGPFAGADAGDDPDRLVTGFRQDVGERGIQFFRR